MFLFGVIRDHNNNEYQSSIPFTLFSANSASRYDRVFSFFVLLSYVVFLFSSVVCLRYASRFPLSYFVLLLSSLLFLLSSSLFLLYSFFVFLSYVFFIRLSLFVLLSSVFFLRSSFFFLLSPFFQHVIHTYISIISYPFATLPLNWL